MPSKPLISLLGLLWISTGMLVAQADNTPLPADAKVLPAAGLVTGKSVAPAATTHLAPIKVTDEVVLDFFQKYEPDVYKQVMVLKEKDKGKYDSVMRDFNHEVGRLLELQRKNEPLFNVTMEDRRIGFESLQLARNIREGKLTPNELDAANRSLETMLDRQFDLRQKIRQAALDDQKARIDALKKNLDNIQKTYEGLLAQFSAREQSKDDLVKQRINDLMKKNPKVEW